MEKIELKIDEDGTLETPDLHDAEVLEISNFDFKQQLLVMKLQTEDGEFELVFKRAVNLKISDMYHQNVIADITVKTGKAVTEENQKILEDYEYEHLNLEKYKFVELNPSVGASTVIVCEKFEIYTL